MLSLPITSATWLGPSWRRQPAGWTPPVPKPEANLLEQKRAKHLKRRAILLKLRRKHKEKRAKEAETWDERFDRTLVDVVCVASDDPLLGQRDKKRNYTFINRPRKVLSTSRAKGGMPEANEPKPKKEYLGKPYQDTENTRFAELLENGSIAVVKRSYFEERLSKNLPFEDRANIPKKYFISGKTLMEQWKKHGAMFLLIFSYAWLTKEHPDPDLFHLRRMVRVLTELKSCHEYLGQHSGAGEVPPEIGVILDYCSLWQKGSGEVDKRSEAQIEDFSDGLQEINTPYAHKDITAVKLMAVPDHVARKYDDRGWTLFESIIIDGKAASAHLGKVAGSWNFLSIDDNFDPDKETKHGIDLIQEFTGAKAKRTPPCTPQRFDQKMKERQERAKEKNVDLFTSGKDQEFIIDKYAKAFEEQVKATQFDFGNMDWGDDEMEILAEVLPQCTRLEILGLYNNHIGDVGTTKLAAALPSLTSLTVLYFGGNAMSDEALSKLKAVWKKVRKENRRRAGGCCVVN